MSLHGGKTKMAICFFNIYEYGTTWHSFISADRDPRAVYTNDWHQPPDTMQQFIEQQQQGITLNIENIHTDQSSIFSMRMLKIVIITTSLSF